MKKAKKKAKKKVSKKKKAKKKVTRGKRAAKKVSICATTRARKVSGTKSTGPRKK